MDTNSKHWWKILKSFIKNPDKFIIYPLKQNDEIYANDKDKANVLNSYFKSLTNLNDSGKALPVIYTMNNNQLSILQTNPYEVQLMLETLKLARHLALILSIITF